MDVPSNMRNYFLAILYEGPTPLERGTPEQRELQARHLTYNKRCVEQGGLKAYGPLTDGGEILAISVYDLPSAEEVRAMLAEDPAFISGQFRADVHPLFWPSLEGMRVEFAAD